jgi:hypothetical protein
VIDAQGGNGAMAPKRQTRKGGKAPREARKMKLNALVDVEVATLAGAYAKIHRTTLGAVVEEALKAHLAGFYVVGRRDGAAGLRVAGGEATAGQGGETEAA